MLVCVGSVKGSPGVTTLAVAMAARWPDGWGRVLVEADPAGGDLAARYGLEVSPGLVSLAVAARRNTDPAQVRLYVQRLPGELPVLVGPARGDQARAALTAICAADSRGGVLAAFAKREDAVAVVDVGRLETGSPVTPLVEVADLLLLVARPRADELAHVAAYADAASLHSGLRRGRTRLLLVGQGYSPEDVQREVGLPVAGTIPMDRRTAAALSGAGAARPSNRSRLIRAAGRVAAELAAGLTVTPHPTPEESPPPGDAVSANGRGPGPHAPVRGGAS